MTQFGRALSELNIDIICANSSQAKGRVERANRTLQDRLVKELRLAGISDMAAGNAFLPGFMADHNLRFAKAPAAEGDEHRPLNLPPHRLDEILCWRDRRYVGAQLAFSYNRRRIILEETELSRGLAGKYVDTYAFPDGRFEAAGPFPIGSSTRSSGSSTPRSSRTSASARCRPRQGNAGPIAAPSGARR